MSMPKSCRSRPEGVQRRPSGLKAVLDPHPVMVLKRRPGSGVVRFVEDPLAAGALDQVVVRAAVDLHQAEPGPLPVKAVTGNRVEAASAPVVVVGADVPHAILAVHVEHVGANHLGRVQRPRRPRGRAPDLPDGARPKSRLSPCSISAWLVRPATRLVWRSRTKGMLHSSKGNSTTSSRESVGLEFMTRIYGISLSVNCPGSLGAISSGSILPSGEEPCKSGADLPTCGAPPGFAGQEN